MQPGEPNNTTPPDEPEEYFSFPVPKQDKALLTVVLFMYREGKRDEEQDKELNQALAEYALEITIYMNELPAEEEMQLPYSGLTVFYNALFLAISIIRSKGGYNLIEQLLEAKNFDRTPTHIKAVQENCVRISTRYIQYLHQRYEKNPAFVELRERVEENWRDIERALGDSEFDLPHV